MTDQVSNTQSSFFSEFIRGEVVKIIEKLLREKNPDLMKIHEIAKITLESTNPKLDISTLFQNAIRLDDKFPELAPIVIRLIEEYEKTYKLKTIDSLSSFIKNGQVDEAENLIKKILRFKIDH